MSVKKSALGSKGRGLNALISAQDDASAENGAVVEVDINKIEPNRNQPRKRFDEEALEALAASIKEQGVIQPLVVEEIVPGHYSIVAGERRFKAAQIAGLDKIPVIIKSLSELHRNQTYDTVCQFPRNTFE